MELNGRNQVSVCVCVEYVSLLGVSINTVKNNTNYGPVNKVGVELNTDKTNWPWHRT
jgi:hypothetical protein